MNIVDRAEHCTVDTVVQEVEGVQIVYDGLRVSKWHVPIVVGV